MSKADCEIRVFHEANLFDDNFKRKWTIEYNDPYVLQTYEDFVVIAITAGKAYAAIGRTVNYAISQFRYVIFKVNTCIGIGSVQVHAGGSWRAKTFTGPGIYTFDVGAVLSGTVDEIMLRIQGVPANQVAIDWLCVCNTAQLVLDEDDALEGSIQVVKRLINDGCNTASFTLNNVGGSYDDVLKGNDVILFYIAKTGQTLVKHFGGRIGKVTDVGGGGLLRLLHVNCVGHGNELVNPPNRLTEIYEGVNGGTIIEDCINLTECVSKHPLKFFNCHAACGISSTHTRTSVDETPITVIRNILDAARNPSAVPGFDGYVTPAGCFVGHLRGSVNHEKAGTVSLKTWNLGYDEHSIINKIKVLGIATKRVPAGDQWCNNTGQPPSVKGWTSDGTLSWGSGLDEWKVGGDSVKSVRAYQSDIYFKNSLPDITSIDLSNYKRITFKAATFWAKWNADPAAPGATSVITIFAFCPDALNCFYLTFDGPKHDEWMWVDKTLSEVAGFLKLGNPDWENCQAVQVKIDMSIHDDIAAFIDFFNLERARYGGQYSDNASQQVHGVKMGATVVKDSLTSDLECELEAEGILNRHKDEKVSLKDLDVEIDFGFILADTVLTSASSSRFKLRRNTISIGPGGELSSIISLSEDPVDVTFAMKDIARRIALLELGS